MRRRTLVHPHHWHHHAAGAAHASTTSTNGPTNSPHYSHAAAPALTAAAPGAAAAAAMRLAPPASTSSSSAASSPSSSPPRNRKGPTASGSSRSSSSSSSASSSASSAAASGSGQSPDEAGEPLALAAYGVVALFAVLCYANSVHGEFVHDDVRVIVENKDVLGVTPLWQVFRHDFWGDPMSHRLSHKSYRPLTILSFRLDHTLFGRNSSWFHVTNVLLHTIACTLFTRVCATIAGLRRSFATLAGIAFAVHPIHTEAVTGIVGRADVLACVFFLISLLAYHGKPSNPSGRALGLSIAAGGASLLAKETGVTVFAVNMAYDMYRSWPTLRKACPDVRWSASYRRQLGRRLATVAAAAGLMLAGRLAVLQGAMPQFSLQENPAACHSSLYVRALTFSYLAAFNWWLILCPAVLSHDWNQDSIPLVTSALDPRNLMTLAACVTLLLLLWRCRSTSTTTTTARRCAAADLCVGTLLLAVPFLPASNLLVTVGFVVAERVLYMPSMGAVLLLAGGVQRAWERRPRWRPALIVAAICLVLAGCGRTVARNRDWHSRELLLRSGLYVLPHNAKMHYNYGNHLRDLRQLRLAAAHYREALRLWPQYASVHNNLGSMLRDVDQAELHFRLAIHYHADHVNAHYNLGRVHKTKNRTVEAVRMFEQCIQLDPSCVRAYTQLIALRRGPIVGRLHREVLRLEPADQTRRAHYGLWLLEQRSIYAAMRQFEMSMQIERTHIVTFVGVCRTLRTLGQTARLHKFVTRWQLMRRIHGSGASRESDVYLRDWSIKYELRNRAMIYDYKSKSPTSNPANAKQAATSQPPPTPKTTTRTTTATTTSKAHQSHGRSALPPSASSPPPSHHHHHHHHHHQHHHHHAQQPQQQHKQQRPPPPPATVRRIEEHRIVERRPNCNMSAESLHRTASTSADDGDHHRQSAQCRRRQQEQQLYDGGGAGVAAEACNQKRWTKSRHKYAGVGGDGDGHGAGEVRRDRRASAAAAAAIVRPVDAAQPHSVAPLSLVPNILDKL